MTGSIRIIAGRLRRRRVPVPEVPGLRPTPDRVRETVFNWLGPHLPGARVLDLFAGTGALGLEAASRDAEQVVCIERDPRLAAALTEQVERLGVQETVRVVRADAVAWLAREARSFDIVLMDPPFDADLHASVAEALQRGGWLAPGALAYIESRARYEALGLPSTWRLLRSNKAGQVRYHLASAEVEDA